MPHPGADNVVTRWGAGGGSVMPPPWADNVVTRWGTGGGSAMPHPGRTMSSPGGARVAGA